MKTSKEFRGKSVALPADDSMKKAVKLPPIKKSGKDRHNLYGILEEEDDPDLDYRVKESVLDYFDDDEEEDL